MQSVRLLRNDVLRGFKPIWSAAQSKKYGEISLESKNRDSNKDPYDDNHSFVECDQYTKVTLIGAAGRVGRTLSLLLKTCPLVDHLCLFDIDKSVKGTGVDISHIDTKCCVSYFCGMKNIHKALDGPDVVVIAAGCPASPQLNGKKLFDKNAPIVAGLSEACARFCPKACVVLITNPINSLVPVMGEVYQMITNRLPYRKLFGLTTLDVVRANTFVAEVVRKDPNSIIVPVVGGTSQETIVPVISQMKPCHKIKRSEMIALTECLKRAEGNLADCQNCGTPGASSLSTAYAAFRFTSSLVMALKGAENIIECAYVKSNIIPELEYLASPLKLGLCGIEHNFGYPQLSDDELAGLEQAATALTSDIKLGKDFARGIQETVHKGLVWKNLSRERKIEEERTKHLRKRKVRLENGEVAGATKALIQVTPQYSEKNQSWFVARVREPIRQLLYGNQTGETEAAEEENGKFSNWNESSKEVEFDSTCWPWTGKLFSKKQGCGDACRLYHTERRSSVSYQEYFNSKNAEKRKKFKREEKLKTILPMKALKVLKNKTKYIQKKSKKPPWELKFERAHYKLLNASAKQKYRSFNVQKKIMPSASVLFLLDKNRRGKQEKNSGLALRDEAEAEADESEAKGKEENDEEPETEHVEVVSKEDNVKDLVPTKSEKEDGTKCRDVVLKQIQDLKRENEELKRKLRQVMENKKLETALQVQTDNLELERTKLKACWLVMSSTMDAFSNFCRKFTTMKAESTGLTDREREEDTDDYHDALESQEPEKRDESYDEKYYNFLKKLMQDQVEGEKARNRVGK